MCSLPGNWNILVLLYRCCYQCHIHWYLQKHTTAQVSDSVHLRGRSNNSASGRNPTCGGNEEVRGLYLHSSGRHRTGNIRADRRRRTSRRCSHTCAGTETPRNCTHPGLSQAERTVRLVQVIRRFTWAEEALQEEREVAPKKSCSCSISLLEEGKLLLLTGRQFRKMQNVLKSQNPVERQINILRNKPASHKEPWLHPRTINLPSGSVMCSSDKQKSMFAPIQWDSVPCFCLFPALVSRFMASPLWPFYLLDFFLQQGWKDDIISCRSLWEMVFCKAMTSVFFLCPAFRLTSQLSNIWS